MLLGLINRGRWFTRSAAMEVHYHATAICTMA